MEVSTTSKTYQSQMLNGYKNNNNAFLNKFFSQFQ